MFELLTKDVWRARQILQEYEEVLDTVEPYYKKFIAYAYVPNIFDVVGAYDEVEWTEDMFFEIYTVFNDYELFFKHEKRFINCPIKEIW